jgi:hypothetical protein
MSVPTLVGKLAGGTWLSKRALLTAFFPNLTLWLAAFVVFDQNRELVTTLESRLKLTDDATAGSFLFIAWVMLWTFVTINLQPAFLRWMQGEWSASGPLALLGRLRRQRWRERLAFLQSLDEVIADLQVKLLETRGSAAMVRGVSDREPPLAVITMDLTACVQLVQCCQLSYRRTVVAHAIRHELEVIDAATSVGDTSTLEAHIEAIGKALESLATVQSSARAALHVGSNTPKRWNVVRAAAIKASTDVAAYADRFRAELDAERDRLLRVTQPFYPPTLLAVTSTRLGNVFRATDERLQLRYGLSPWLLVSHLRLVLPKGPAEALLEDATIGLYLAVTVSFMLAVFGVVFSLWLPSAWPAHACHHQEQVETVSFVVAALAGLFALRFLWRQRMLREALAGFVGVAAIMIAARAQGISATQVTIFAAGVVLTFVVCWLPYSNAVEAGVVYCAVVATLFDAHRGKILSALQLRLPSNLDDERYLWKQVTEHLARSYTPNARYYSYATAAGALAPQGDQRSETKVLGTSRDLPGLRTLRAGDLVTISTRKSAAGAYLPVSDARAAEGMLLLCPLESGQPVPRKAVVDAKRMNARVVLSMNVLGDALPPSTVVGDDVELVFMDSAKPPAPHSFSVIVVALAATEVTRVRDTLAATPEELMPSSSAPVSSPALKGATVAMSIAAPITQRDEIVALIAAGAPFAVMRVA